MEADCRVSGTAWEHARVGAVVLGTYTTYPHAQVSLLSVTQIHIVVHTLTHTFYTHIHTPICTHTYIQTRAYIHTYTHTHSGMDSMAQLQEEHARLSVENEYLRQALGDRGAAVLEDVDLSALPPYVLFCCVLWCCGKVGCSGGLCM